MKSTIDNEIIEILKKKPILLSAKKILTLADKNGDLHKMSLQSLAHYLKKMYEDKKIGMVKIQSGNRYCELHLQRELAEKKKESDIKRGVALNSTLDMDINSDEEGIALLEKENLLNENEPYVCEIRNLEQQINKIKEAPNIKQNGKILATLAIIGGVLLSIGLGLIGEMPETALVFLLFSLAVLIPAIIYSLKPMTQSKANAENLQTLENRLSQLLTIDTKAVKFYEECTKIISKGKKITETISIVGQKYGFYDINQAHSYYKKGESERKKQVVIEAYKKDKASKEKLLELHKQEQKNANEIREKKFKKGKEKYLVVLRKWISLIESQKRVAENMRTLSTCNANYRARTSDWAIAGGVGSALGGAGLGVAAAIDTQVKNEKEKERAQRKHELSRTQSSIAFDIEYGATSEEKKALKFLQMMEDVLIDEQNINAKFKLLEYTNVHIGLTKGQNLFVSMTLKCLSKPTILSKPAIFDGALKISIFDKGNNIVATGYYIADGYEEYNYQYAGFKAEENIKVICPIDSSVKIEELRCEVAPESLWFIEENKQIFRVVNSEIIKGYNAYKKVYAEQAKNVLLNM